MLVQTPQNEVVNLEHYPKPLVLIKRVFDGLVDSRCEAAIYAVNPFVGLEYMPIYTLLYKGTLAQCQKMMSKIRLAYAGGQPDFVIHEDGDVSADDSETLTSSDEGFWELAVDDDDEIPF